MAAGIKVSDEIRVKCWMMADDGAAIRDIAEAVGIPKGTVGGIVARYRKSTGTIKRRHENLTDGEKRHIVSMAEEGYSYPDIAKAIGVGKGTIKRVVWDLGYRRRKPYQKRSDFQYLEGFNADRSLCRECKYRSKNIGNDTSKGNPGCDFFLWEDIERGCTVEMCNRFEKGDSMTQAKIKKKRKDDLHTKYLNAKEYEETARRICKTRPDIKRMLDMQN